MGNLTSNAVEKMIGYEGMDFFLPFQKANKKLIAAATTGISLIFLPEGIFCFAFFFFVYSIPNKDMEEWLNS